MAGRASGRSQWLILGAIVAQLALLAYVSGVSTEGWLVAGVTLVAACTLTRVVWSHRHRYRGIDKVVVPLAFGGLGVVIGHMWVGLLDASAAGEAGGGAHGGTRHLLIMATMLALCLPACVFLCSHDTCGARRRTVIVELAVLHLLMMGGMFAVSWIVMQSHASRPGPIWSYAGGLLGMGLGAVVAVFALQRWSRRRPRNDCGA